MSVYPIVVRKQSGRAPSSSGGKDYHLVLIQTEDRRAVVIFRYGKRGQWGTGFEVKTFTDVSEAGRVYWAKHREKLGREYTEHFIDSEKFCNDEAEFRAALGPQYWAKMGAEALEFLIPGIDTTGVKKQESVEWEKKGDRYVAKERKPRMVEPEPEPVEERAKSDPLFGLF